ncbi:MAG: molybdopterin-dependent oxidoreductase [Dehalococcoidales bacterium]|nr:molybdopterin-dependent oxidoreductase [Dehalococcoidales bacterium]
MQEIILTINGIKVKGSQGDSVLDVCKRNGIDVPTLCHLPGVTDIAACRICVVEIEGERRVTPSCTYPARDGLVVRTDTEKLEKYRRQVLELLFTERNHFCMFCEQSGDCELQKMAYRYQMENVRYEYLFPRMKVDTLSRYLAIDHNRCILCGRCIRVCDQLEAVHTLDFGGRGHNTTVCADIDTPLGESTCTQCGACLQACPTGAIMSKVSMYKGKSDNCQIIQTICQNCSIGCELNVLVKDNNIVRIQAPDIASPRGVLCRIGRFDDLQPQGTRILSPLVRNKEGKLDKCSLDEAISLIASKMTEFEGDFGGIISSRSTSEALHAFQGLFNTASNSLVDTLDGEKYRLLFQELKHLNRKQEYDLPFEALAQADCILVIGTDLADTHPMAATFIRRYLKRNNTQLIVIDGVKDNFGIYTDLWLQPKPGTEDSLINGLFNLINPDNSTPNGEDVTTRLQQITGIEPSLTHAAVSIIHQSRHPIIVYGNGTAETDVAIAESLARLSTWNGDAVHPGMIALKPSINSQEAWRLGLASQNISSNGMKGLYLLLSDNNLDEKTIELLRKVAFRVVQASYFSPATELADIIIPSPVWSEREGSYTTTDGRKVHANGVLEPAPGILQDKDILIRLTKTFVDNLNRKSGG